MNNTKKELLITVKALHKISNKTIEELLNNPITTLCVSDLRLINRKLENAFSELFQLQYTINRITERNREAYCLKFKK